MVALGGQVASAMAPLLLQFVVQARRASMQGGWMPQTSPQGERMALKKDIQCGRGTVGIAGGAGVTIWEGDQSLEDNAPIPRQVDPPERGEIIAIPQVGGLHHRYARAA